MGTKIATGISTGRNGSEAARVAARQAIEKIGDRKVDMSIVYSSSAYNYRDVVDAVREATGNAPLMGASSAGEFTEKDVLHGSVAVCLLASDDIRFFTAMAEGVGDDPEGAVRRLAEKMPETVEDRPHRCIIMIADGLAGVGEEIVLSAINIMGGDTPIVGGMAGDDMKFEKTHLFLDGDVVTDGICICLLASTMPLFTAVKHGHRPLTEPLTVTRALGNVVYEINNKPAWGVWKEEVIAHRVRKAGEPEPWHELATQSDIGQFLANYEMGLPIETEGEYKVRFPSGVNDDGSLNFSCGIAEGTVFRIMDGSDMGDQIEAAGDAAGMARQAAEDAGYTRFAGAFVFECAVRRLMLGDEFYRAPDAMAKVLDGIPMIGFETYGEIRLEPGQFSGYHNTTSVILLVPENE